MTANTKFILFMYINSHDNQAIHDFYKTRADNHNNLLSRDYVDSGFDLAIPTQKIIYSNSISNKIPLDIQCSMYHIDGTPQAFYLYPRSSIIKTPLRLSNSVGIIDRGYRGPITAVVDNISTNEHVTLDKLNRYFQICHPYLEPFKIKLVNSKDDLGNTQRDEGGFGSTGR